jgi:site-specific DNA-methyltransferase (adenine-specific)
VNVYVDVLNIAREIGYQYKCTIIWDKNNVSRRTAFGSWLSASAPSVIAPIEVIAVLYKKRWKKETANGVSDITKDEFIAWTSGLWSFTGDSNPLHPSSFPVELPLRCVKLFSFIGDMVLDPFLGTGGTMEACIRTGRKAIGIEIDKKYYDIAKARIQQSIQS